MSKYPQESINIGYVLETSTPDDKPWDDFVDEKQSVHIADQGMTAKPATGDIALQTNSTGEAQQTMKLVLVEKFISTLQ